MSEMIKTANAASLVLIQALMADTNAAEATIRLTGVTLTAYPERGQRDYQITIKEVPRGKP
jgi:hypothetical protein